MSFVTANPPRCEVLLRAVRSPRHVLKGEQSALAAVSRDMEPLVIGGNRRGVGLGGRGRCRGGSVGLWLLVTAMACLPAPAPVWLRSTGALAAAVFLTVAVFEGSWTSLLAGIGALTLAPVFFGGLALQVRRWPEPARPGAGAA